MQFLPFLSKILHNSIENGSFGSCLDPFGRLLAFLIRALPLSLSVIVPKVGTAHDWRLQIQRAGKKITVASRTTKIPFRVEG